MQSFPKYKFAVMGFLDSLQVEIERKEEKEGEIRKEK